MFDFNRWYIPILDNRHLEYSIKLSKFNVRSQMIKKSLSILCRSPTIVINKYYSTRKLSKVDLSVQMKNLNDKKQYEKTLTLFYQNSTSVTDVSINQALKACTKQRDLQRGKNIHQQLSSSSLENPFIQCSLLHLYS